MEAVYGVRVSFSGCRLGVDFGTSSTVAVLADPDGTTRPVLFDGSPTLPSGVCADGSGALLVGGDAWHAAGSAPECFEPHPKRRIDDGVVSLGDVEVTVAEVFAAVLRRVAVEALRAAGAPPDSVTLTCPVAWGSRRREILLAAARAAGFGPVSLVTEPVAAANYFLPLSGGRIPVGSCAVVYDLGAGTFDASVVRRTADGFDVLASVGRDDGGGLDLDAAIVAHLAATYAGRDQAAWQRLTRPTTTPDQRAARALWDGVRTGREMLSRTAATFIHVPLLDVDAPLGREQFDELARPVLDRTVAATLDATRAAGIDLEAVGGVFLVGGATRTPLVATLLHRALRRAPDVVDQPDLAVAHGSLASTAAAGPLPATHPVPLGGHRSVSWPPAGPPPGAEPEASDPNRLVEVPPPALDLPASRLLPSRRLRLAVLAGIVVVLAAAVVAVIAIRPWSPHGSSASPATSASPGSRVPRGLTSARKPDPVEMAVFLRGDATEPQRQAIEAKLRAIPGARAITFETHEQAYQHFKEQFKDRPDLVAATSPDSLPESFRLTLTDPVATQPQVAQVSALPGVDQVTVALHGTVWDATRAANGAWTQSTMIDNNASITRAANAALPDGTLHVQTLVPGSGVWDRTRTKDGTWSSGTQVDSNGSSTAVSAAGLPDGTLHVLTVDSTGVWDRTRNTDGTWNSSSRSTTMARSPRSRRPGCPTARCMSSPLTVRACGTARATPPAAGTAQQTSIAPAASSTHVRSDYPMGPCT